MKLGLNITQSPLYITDYLQVITTEEEPIKRNATVIDIEVFINQAFETDPKHGCELLYRHYYAALCSHAVRFVTSKTVAEDLVSEIFYQFYQKGTHDSITVSYRAYLYKAVRNSAYNYLRWEANRTADLELCANYAGLECEQPDAKCQYEELYEHVETAINHLPPQRRKVYVMHRFENKKYTEIAAELQLSPRTVEAQIRKASLYLKDLLLKNWLLSIVGSFAWLV